MFLDPTNMGLNTKKLPKSLRSQNMVYNSLHGNHIHFMQSRYFFICKLGVSRCLKVPNNAIMMVLDHKNIDTDTIINFPLVSDPNTWAAIGFIWIYAN